MTEHTPGPWTVYTADEVVGVTCRTQQHLDSDGDGADICEIVNRDYFGRPVANANAALIAAAPELLEAIRQIANYTPASTVQPVAIARSICEKHSFPWLSASNPTS